MTNQDRRQKRYERRQIKRKQKRDSFLQKMPSYTEVFTFENLWNSFWLCRKEVSWKPSIQIFQQNLSIEIIKLLKELYSEKGFRSRGFIEFDICERGKIRHIKSVDIRERIVQRCFCDYYLVPLLTRFLVYDNGASLKGKGVDFSLKRLKKHLVDYYKKYKTNEGWIVLYDFSNYFGSIDHKFLYENVDRLILDDRCKKLYHHLVDAFGDVGLGLGSQVSQISAVAFPTQIDKKIANFISTESSARYMDDGYVIFHKKEDAKKCVSMLIEETSKINININPKKISINKLSRTFIYLKKRFFLNDTGQVVMRLNRNNVYKHKRRVYKLFNLVEQNKLVVEDIELCHKSWYGQVIKKFKNRKSIYNVDLEIRRKINDNNTDIPSNQRCISKDKRR